MIKPPPSAVGIASDAQKLERMRRLSLVDTPTRETTTPTAAPPEPVPQDHLDEAGQSAPTSPPEAPIAPPERVLDAAPPRAEPKLSPAQTERAATLFSLVPTAATISQPSSGLLNSINLVLPPHIFDAIERAAQNRRWTKKCLILTALRQFGVDIPEAALIPDGRRIRGRPFSR